jgi:hypothetical protein
MKKGDIKLTFTNFEYWMGWYIQFLQKALQAERVIGTPREKKELLEAFVFKIVAQWEIFAEDLLVDCLNRDSSAYSQHMGLRLKKHLTRSECRAMVIGLGYLDFRSVSHLQGIAKRILTRPNNPFRAIPKNAGDKIDEFFCIRNYLAHYSVPARRSLLNIYQKEYDLKNFREPGDFLYASRGQGGQIRFGDYVDAFAEASHEMRNALGVAL